MISQMVWAAFARGDVEYIHAGMTRQIPAAAFDKARIAR